MSGCWTTRAPSASAISRVRSVDAESMTRTSSSSGTRPTISRIARRTIGPIVSSSLSVGSTRLIVSFCFSLSVTRRRRSANSAWWKFDSPNQRSTRTGTARASSAARSAAASVSARAASWSNVVRSMVSRVLTTMTVGWARAAIASGSEPNRYVSPSAPPGCADAPMTTRSDLLRLAQDRVADVGRLAQDGLAAAADVLLDERGQRPLGLGPDGEGDPGRDEVEDDDRRVVVARDRVGETERELGVRAAADRDEDPPDLLRCRAA